MRGDFLALVRAIFGTQTLPRPFDLLELAAGRAAEPSSANLSHAARKLITELRVSGNPTLRALDLPENFTAEPRQRDRVQTMLGQLLLGLLAERAFEEIYKTTLGTTELRLEDAREGRTDTDYRVLNGAGRPVFRMNIKFHGTLFRQAMELVGLAPEDCFALATYKIKQGLDKQDSEVLPYVFVVLSCPVSALDVGAAIPSEFVDLGCLVHASRRITGKRRIEEKIVECLADGGVPSFSTTLMELRVKIAAAPWRILSARRADRLLRDKLFERVYAVRVRGFTRSYQRAEVDMHFSLASDMTPLPDLLKKIGEVGLHGVTGMLERGLL
jgi:hypothetical protein